MPAAELWAAWRFWMVIGVAVVVVAAALLVTIWLTALSIAAHARRALRAAETIRANTRPIWQLEATNDVAVELRDTVQRIEAGCAALVEALQHPTAAGGRR
jgi:hypothetical protein